VTHDGQSNAVEMTTVHSDEVTIENTNFKLYVVDVDRLEGKITFKK
jgi:hypothetical protein